MSVTNVWHNKQRFSSYLATQITTRSTTCLFAKKETTHKNPFNKDTFDFIN